MKSPALPTVANLGGIWVLTGEISFTPNARSADKL